MSALSSFRNLLASLPFLALVAAALETLLVRARLPWRPSGIELFLQALALWIVFALLALLPALATTVLLERRRVHRSPATRPRAGTAAAVLLGWMTVPVVAHATLDRHVGLEGELSALRAPRPWLEVLAVLIVAVLALLVLDRCLRRVRPAAAALVAALGALLVGVLPGGPDASATDGAGAAGRPNLLLVVWDTCRSDLLIPYGHTRETTPHLADLAAESVVFENAVSAATFTFSSHLSMLTGVLPSTHGGRLLSTRYDPRRARTVADVLRRAGYRTGAFVGTDVLAGRTGIRHGFELYDDRVDPAVCDTHAWKLVHDLQSLAARFVPSLEKNGNPHWIQDFQRPGDGVLASALEWIERDDPRPWFAFVNLYDVHWPYVPESDPRGLVGDYDGPVDGYLFRSDAWTPGYEVTEEDKRHVVELYEAELAALDREVDGFLAALGLERGGTAVLMTSDHGEAFGEAGHWKHEDVLEPQVRVPLILRTPEAAPEGRRVSAPTSGIDVGPTLLALAGVERPADMQGVSLLDDIPEDRVVLVEDRDHLDPLDVRVALYRGPWKLVRWGLGDDVRHELYDLRTDPLGVEDVSARHPQVFDDLRELLAERRRAADTADREVDVEGSGADGLHALGYTGE
jgi:arylsulfatase A-like enzyme